MKTGNGKIRCKWAEGHELLAAYHDNEWGVPVHDDRQLFEMLNLEGAQAGLNWLTILKKRDGYRKAFRNFDAKKLARFTAAQQTALLLDEGIVRNRLKIHAVIENAKVFLDVQREFGTFDDYIWGLIGGKPVPKKDAAAASEQMSKSLKKRGFRFVGATICYAFMQAVGMLDDHSKDCFRSRHILR
ncbi:MAG TPA: DNA-3-methyladenine glycosylase I [Terriglobia bacterium]